VLSERGRVRCVEVDSFDHRAPRWSRRAFLEAPMLSERKVMQRPPTNGTHLRKGGTQLRPRIARGRVRAEVCAIRRSTAGSEAVEGDIGDRSICSGLAVRIAAIGAAIRHVHRRRTRCPSYDACPLRANEQ
jgi:hypothetical protein